MERRNTMNANRHTESRSVPGLRDRRAFLTRAGTYGALLMSGPYITATAALGSGALAAQAGPGDAGDVRVVQEKAKMLRIFGLMQRAPGMTKGETRVKSPQGYWGYARDVYLAATKKVHGQALQHIHNVITDSAFGDVGQTSCPALSNRDYVAEFSMDANPPAVPIRGAGATGDMTPRQAQAETRRPSLPDFIEGGTDLSVVTRQVLAQGTRPPGTAGRERGMHFIRMSPAIPAADHVQVWQGLHAKAMQATPAFSEGLAGFEVLPRLADTAARQVSRCGAEMPVADLVACFWSKTKNAAEQFPSYVRALRQADQQKAMDGPASFFFLVEEWEVMTQPSFVG